MIRFKINEHKREGEYPYPRNILGYTTINVLAFNYDSYGSALITSDEYDGYTHLDKLDVEFLIQSKWYELIK